MSLFDPVLRDPYSKKLLPNLNAGTQPSSKIPAQIDLFIRAILHSGNIIQNDIIVNFFRDSHIQRILHAKTSSRSGGIIGHSQQTFASDGRISANLWDRDCCPRNGHSGLVGDGVSLAGVVV